MSSVYGSVTCTGSIRQTLNPETKKPYTDKHIMTSLKLDVLYPAVGYMQQQ